MGVAMRPTLLYLVSKQPSEMSETPKKRKLEEIIDLNDGFCQTPPNIHCLKKGEKAEEAFAGVSEFWDKDLEYFEALTTAESQLILADNHHFENNDLFVIDE